TRVDAVAGTIELSFTSSHPWVGSLAFFDSRVGRTNPAHSKNTVVVTHTPDVVLTGTLPINTTDRVATYDADPLYIRFSFDEAGEQRSSVNNATFLRRLGDFADASALKGLLIGVGPAAPLLLLLLSARRLGAASPRWSPLLRLTKVLLAFHFARVALAELIDL